MDTKIDLQGAFSVETKAEKTVFKLPESAKKIEFFSRVGKSRLLRICQDNNLDQEILFTGWVGPSDSFVREQVSDHVQHYLFKRARRLSINRRIYDEKKKLAANAKAPEQDKKFLDYENYVKRKNEMIDESRMDQEINRIKRLLISGEIKTAPEGFGDIINDPIYKINRLSERVKTMIKAELKGKPHPLELRNVTPIKNLNKVTESKNTPRKASSSIDYLGGDSTHRLTPKSSLSEIESLSSGFQENTVSNKKDTDASRSPFSNGGIIIDSPSELEKIHTNSMQKCSYSNSEGSDDEELLFEDDVSFLNDISGDLEMNLFLICNSEPMKMMKNQHSCSNLYKIGSEVVDMYMRQQIVGVEFMEGFTARFFGKQQTS